NYTTRGSPATDTNHNNDSATLPITNQPVTEGIDVWFTVAVSNDAQRGVKVDYATSDGTAKLSDSDYSSAGGTLCFAGTAGEQHKIGRATCRERMAESEVTVSVRLINVTRPGAGVNSSKRRRPEDCATVTL